MDTASGSVDPSQKVFEWVELRRSWRATLQDRHQGIVDMLGAIWFLSAADSDTPQGHAYTGILVALL